MTAKKIIIVLSTHRSGTITLARALSTMGVELGDALHPIGMDNTASFWEDRDVIAVNNKLLSRLDSAYGRGRVLDIDLNGDAVIDEIYQEAKALITDKAPDIPMWGMKDPQMLQLLPFWQKLLKELEFDISYVIVLHSPLNGLEPMLQAVADTTSENRLFVGYDNLLNNPRQELLRISSTLDLPTPTEDEISKYINEFLDSGVRHAQHLESERLNGQIEPKILADANLESITLKTQIEALMTETEAAHLATISNSNLPSKTIMKNNEQVVQEQSVTVKLSDENTRLKSELANLSSQHKKLEINLEEWKSSEARFASYLGKLEDSLAEYEVAAEADLQKYRSLEEQTQREIGLKQEHIQTLSNSWERFFNSRLWRLISLPDIKKRLPSIILPNGEAFDENYYLETYPDVKATGIPAVVHYLSHGIQEGRLGSPKSIPHAPRTLADEKPVLAGGLLYEPTEPFNADFYRAMYPVLASLADPERHFLDHGQAEGLLGRVPSITLSRPIESLPADKPTILLISHEASRTGAPILSLNIVQQLTSQFNVVTLLLGGGPLVESFIDAGAIVAGPVDLYHKETFADWVIGKFLDAHSFQFAIANSLGSYIALKPLADRYIPTISLIHEFAVYIRPRTAIQNAMLWASQTVFSADITLDSAIQVLPELSSCQLPVLAQGKSIIPGETHDPAHIEAEKAMLQKIMRPDGPEDDTIVILGAGWVQIRKGVDLFIECATRVINSPIGHKCRFVWIGNNYNPEQDTQYSLYLQDQIQRAGISERFKIISETAAIEHVYALSDMMLLTARLDPLPNVAIDAMVRGLPVLCFDKTTGIADILKRNGLQEECVAPYLDTHNMADKIIRLASSQEARDKVGEQARDLAVREFNMPRYVEQLLALTEGNAALSRQEQVDAATIEQAGVVDLDYYPPASVQLSGATEAIRRYVRSWTRGVLRRKLFPGFDPSVYQDMNASAIGAQDPLAHFLSAGRPEGSWNLQNLSWKGHSTLSADSKSLIFISLRSADFIGQIVKLLVKRSAQIDVVILVPDELAALTINQCLQKEKYSVLSTLVSEDQPLLAILKHLASVPYLDYTAIAHINLSTDPIDIDFSDRETYQQYLIENMIGGKYDALGVIAGRLSGDSSDMDLGLVFPEDPNIHDATADAEIISSLCQSLGFEAPASHHLPYPVNGSFWGAPTILNTLLANADGWKSTLKNLKLTPAEQERILARLLVQACRNNGKHIATTVVPGNTY